ncbi:MAG: EamA/RhaT family transporter [Thermoprotei archaeon]|nr:MAG: EamA/RhaT family transporter [Thermoprotei archaeon]
MNVNKLLLLILAVFAVSWASIFVRLSNAPATICAFWRVLISSLLILLLGHSMFLEELKSISIKDLGYLAFSGTALALHFALWMKSLFHTSIAISTTIVSSHPIFASLFIFAFIREKPLRIQILGLILAIIGINILSFSGEIYFSNILGPLLALAGAICAGAYFAIGRVLRQRISLVTYASIVYLVAAIVLFMINIIYHIPLMSYPLHSWIFFLLLALVPMMLGHTVLNYLLKYSKTITITSVTLGEPIGATLLALLLLNEAPATMTYLGMVITLIGIAIVLLYEK